MRDVPDTTGFNGYGETSWETGDSAKTSPGKVFYQDLINKANTVPLSQILRHYGVCVQSVQCNVVCPFKSHKSGRENSGSFVYYPNTNSFRCYGCQTGHPNAHGCEFIAAMDGISRVQAAHKIIELFSNSVSDIYEILDVQNYSETLEIMLDFSNTVREFRQSHFDEKSQAFIERMCLVYDDVYVKHHTKTKKLSNDAIRRMIQLLKEKINIYICLTQ
jgi:hypothetical protein